MSGSGPIVFLHIPKTAGSTFGSVLRRNAPAGDFHVPNVCRESEALAVRLESIARQPRGKVQTIRGHVSMSWRDRLPSDARFATFLREPVARQLSNYRHLYGKRLAAGDAVPVEEALASGRLIDNLQTRMLCGLDDSLHRPADDELLRAALHELERLDFVGLTERFAESMLLARETLGLRSIAYRAERVGAARSGIAGIDALRAHNELDLVLYERARRLVDPRLDAMSRPRARALERADTMLRTHRPVADPRAAVVAASYGLTTARIVLARKVARARKSAMARRLRRVDAAGGAL